MTPLQLHRKKWSDGCGHECCGRAEKVVLYRGRIPADITFVGEAPGITEDTAGVPFWGPAGDLLDRMIEEAFEGFAVTWNFTNLVGCLPSGEDGKKSGEPTREQVKSCQPRLSEFLAIAKPKMLVAVGSCADKHLGSAMPKGVTLYAGGKVDGPTRVERWVSVQHPAFILRSVQAQRGLSIQRVVVTLRSAVRKLVNPDDVVPF